MRLLDALRLGALALAMGSAAAQAAAGQTADPGRAAPQVTRAARLTYVAGAVSVQRSDNTAEDTPVLNMPLAEGTRLVTGDYGQAEIEFEDGSVARLTPRSSMTLDVLSLADNKAKTELTVLNGLIYFELRKSSGSAYRVDVAGMQIVPVENATIRIKTDDPPPSVAILTGSVRVEKAEGFRTVVKTGEILSPEDQDGMRFSLSAQMPEESWDRWNESRDQLAADEVEKRTPARDGFAGTQGYGWADLDSNGSWYDLPGTGQVWQPNVADEGFDPYGYGSWVWSGSGGYIFVSGYSWGWTPFRCGAWNFFPGFGWAWVPGRSCGAWGYAGFDEGGYGGGWGGVRVGRGPVEYRPIQIPLPGPGKVHPIVTVRGPDGTRPPVLRGRPIQVGGVMRDPLRPVGGGGPHGGRAVGQSLNRDFPVDVKTGRPVLGREPGSVAVNDPAESGARPGSGEMHSGSRNGIVRGTMPVVQAPYVQQPIPGGRVPMAPPATVPVVKTPRTPPATVPAPVREPVQAAPVRSAPAPNPPAAIRSAPAPAPARSDPGKANPKW